MIEHISYANANPEELLWPDNARTQIVAELADECLSKNFEFPGEYETFPSQEYRREPSPPSKETIEYVIEQVAVNYRHSVPLKSIARSIRQSLAHPILWDHDLDNRHLHDALTGLPNKRSYEADKLIADGRFDVSFVYLDIDNFKTINDSHGHQAGDEILKTVASGLRNSLDGIADTTVYHLHGDEFVVITDFARPSYIVERCKAGVREELTANTEIVTKSGRVIPMAAIGEVSISAGIGHDEDEADADMYRHKRADKAARLAMRRLQD
ncbi:MAG: GGDEF domain-containing protein [Patescibacteria group bacterium]|nr:GGDEF domain-containing protein [Patescibacteria group bacterium]